MTTLTQQQKDRLAQLVEPWTDRKVEPGMIALVYVFGFIEPWLASRVWSWFVAEPTGLVLGYWAFFGLVGVRTMFYTSRFPPGSKITNAFALNTVLVKIIVFGVCAAAYYWILT